MWEPRNKTRKPRRNIIINRSRLHDSAVAMSNGLRKATFYGNPLVDTEIGVTGDNKPGVLLIPWMLVHKRPSE